MRASNRFLSVLFIATAALLAGHAAGADNHLARPVRIVVALSAGSQTDILARMLAPKLSDNWRQPVVVDNRPGGAGGIAGGILVKSAPDGHTLMMYSDGHAVNAALSPEILPFDTLRDIARVSKVAAMPSILVVSSTLGPRTVKDLITLGKAKPGQLSFGSAGIGGGLHLSGELFRMAGGFDAVHVPYKGTPEALADTMSGRVQFMFSSPGPALPHIRSGRILPLGVGTSQRVAMLPDVPTIAEAGIPGFEYELWQGVFAPAGTPRAIVNQINREIDRIVALPEIREQFAAQSLMYRSHSPDEFDRFVRAEVAKLVEVIKKAGIKLK